LIAGGDENRVMFTLLTMDDELLLTRGFKGNLSQGTCEGELELDK
jgi:hypothetical protein